MATYQTTLDALINPGNDSNYFDQSVFSKDLPPLDPATKTFSAINAWWLMDISRLIYNIASDARRNALTRAHLEEVRFVDHPEIQYSLLSPIDKNEKYAVVAFRGTHDPTDVVTDLKVDLDTWEGKGRVHKGFRDALNCIWEGLSAKLENLDPGTTIIFTGHSLGAALATLAAARWGADGRKPTVGYTFGSPKVGDNDFVGSLGLLSIYRVVDGKDGVTEVPDPGYAHVGEVHQLDSGYPPGTLFSRVLAAMRSLMGNVKDFLKDLKADAVLPQILTDHTPINYRVDLEPQVRPELSKMAPRVP